MKDHLSVKKSYKRKINKVPLCVKKSMRKLQKLMVKLLVQQPASMK
jgi:hypothetical protein